MQKITDGSQCRKKRLITNIIVQNAKQLTGRKMKKLIEQVKEEYSFLETDEKCLVWAVVIVFTVLLPYKIFMGSIA